MTHVDDIIKFAIENLGSDILDSSGSVMYSSVKTLQPSSIYLLGHNPGGSPDDIKDTVRASLNNLPSYNDNSYIDEIWTTGKKGDAPLQRRVVWLLKQLISDPSHVPSTNLIFARSVDVERSSYKDYSDRCWAVHEKILEIVKPKLLLVFGNSHPSPYTYLRDKFPVMLEESYRSGHGNWLCRSFKVDSKFTVVGLPHLSRYDIIGKTDVIDWIKTKLP
ncbi:MAG: hypothetical protein KAJ86_00585 [Alphaproteobacteria bacterium]|nr:hypothetical protein [Alphaproteobacteria bacterium]